MGSRSANINGEETSLLAPDRTRENQNVSVSAPQGSRAMANVSDERQGSGSVQQRPVEQPQTIIRRPISFNNPRHTYAYSINDGNFDSESIGDPEREALLARYKYISRLDSRAGSSLVMPVHVVPEEYLIEVLIPVRGKQSSIITIFAFWNTMMGTSLLSMPWALQQAGYVCGIILLIAMALLMGYTAYLVLKSVDFLQGETVKEFAGVCRHFLGRFSEVLAIVCSLMALLGGAIVYWILMSNFLYHIVYFVFSHAHDTGSSMPAPVNTSLQYNDVVCKGSDNTTVNSSDSTAVTFGHVWDETKTVPFFLICILFPLICFKSPTFFSKLGALGTLSVTYLIVFATVKAGIWKFHLHLGAGMEFSDGDPYLTPAFRWTFPALTGISALAYFVHNCVLTITANQEKPQHNVRDLVIAYILVALTYMYMGIVFFTSYPLPKSCIEDNLLNNMASDDIMSLVARIGLFLQMTCIFPLLTYIFRVQVLLAIFGSEWPSWRHVAGLNAILVGLCLIFAVFLPHIGKIIGFVGAFCGLTYAIALPCIVYILAHRQQGTLTWLKLIFHIFLIVIGLGNFVAQFVLLGTEQSS